MDANASLSRQAPPNHARVGTRVKVIVGWLSIIAVVGAACDGEAAEPATTSTPPSTTTTTQSVATTQQVATTQRAPVTTTAAAPPPLLIWADERRAAVLEEVALAFTDQTDIEVSIEVIDFGDIRGLILASAPGGAGPDLYVGAHGWTAELAAAGVAEPVGLGGREDEFFQVAINTFSFEGTLFGLPYGIEALAMYYNTDLVPSPPSAFEELESICNALSGIENCIGVPGGADGPDAFHNFPFLSALGGYVFGHDPATGHNVRDIGIDSAEAVAGITFLEEQVAAGVVGSVNYDGAKTLFLEGKQPFWLAGPWEISELSGATVSWSVATIPTIHGNTPRPFVSADGLFISAFSESKAAASTFLLDFVATIETMEALYAPQRQSPAYKAALDGIAEDPAAAAFALSAADGVAVPSVPEMGFVWSPLGSNIAAVRNGDLSAGDAMDAAGRAVRDAIAAS